MSSGKKTEAEVLSAHFPDPKDAEAVREAAKQAGVSPSMFLREAGLEAAAKARGVCPTCKQPRGKPSRAKKAA